MQAIPSFSTTKTPQIIFMNLVKRGSDLSYILLKNLIVRMQSEKAFYIGSSTI